MKREQSKTCAIVVLAVALAVSLRLHILPAPQPGMAEESATSLPVQGTSASVAEAEPASRQEPDTQTEPARVDPAGEETSPDPNQEPEVPHEAMEDNISLEIERKFLVAPEALPQNMQSIAHSYTIEQTYLSIEPEIRLRRINGGTQYWFAVKLPKDETGLSRAEMDFMVSEDVYNSLIGMMMGDTVHKTRYQFEENGVMVFVDVYAGHLEGLAVVEVEFESEDEANAFAPPAWFGEDVTADKRYKNAQLAVNGLPEPRILMEEE